jgi:hypothetical protein
MFATTKDVETAAENEKAPCLKATMRKIGVEISRHPTSFSRIASILNAIGTRWQELVKRSRALY